MTKTISATEARIHFGEMIRRVTEQDETIIVERSGKPQMVLMSVEQYEALRAQQPTPVPDWKKQVIEVRRRMKAELAGRSLPPEDELIREMREERDAYLNDLY